MNLTQEEKAMLEGEYGEGKALAMEIQKAIGEAFGAEKMAKISRAHVALSNQEADLWFAEKMLKKGAECEVPPTVNPPYNLEYFQEQGIEFTEKEVEIINRTRDAYREIGAVLTYNCTPYLEKNIPAFGEVVAFSESSATPYINSVYGARTNRESSQSALCAAITGRTPLYGLLLEENRGGDVLVEVKAGVKNDFDFQLLGYTIPEKIGYEDIIPVLTGLDDDISEESLMNFGAQLNTSGAVSMYHIVGVTPEADTLKEAFRGGEPEKKVEITEEDLSRTHKKLSSSESEIEFALMGCPHLTIEQVGNIVDTLAGRSFSVPFWVCTSNMTRNLAEKMGYLEEIERAGGHIVTETCIDQPCWKFLRNKKGVTDSPKCAYYTKRRDLEFEIVGLEKCVEAAVEGELQ